MGMEHAAGALSDDPQQLLQDDAGAVVWETVANADFDEVVAKIIVNPQSALDEIENALIRRESDGSTLLHVVAGWSNCQDLVAQLLRAGIPADARDTSGWTPLLEAAQEGQIPVCKVLLANGATPDLAVSVLLPPHSPTHPHASTRAVTNGGDPPMVQLTPLRAAAEVGNSEMTTWLLTQPGTWSGKWDNEFFAFLLEKTPDAVSTYLDNFATALNHSKRGYTAVKYSNLRYIYGEPSVPVEHTALALAVKSANARDILSHCIMRYLVKAKWKAFAKSMFRREFSAYCTLLVAYYVPTVWADPDWIHLATAFDYWVAFSRFISWICSAYLLFRVELNEFLGGSAKSYFGSFWNLLNIVTYVTTMATIPLEFVASLSQVRNSFLALIIVSLWLNLLQFLQMSTESGLLIAMMSHMSKDVYRFLLLYAVFLFGFSGAFYILLRGSTGYENFTNSFITVFLMLYGQITFDTFNATTGWIWHSSVGLLMVYLMSVVIVLLNILIAMMATTYSDVWESAEAEALQSHAQAIIRMEKALRAKDRERTFQRLLRVDMRHLMSKQRTVSSKSSNNMSAVLVQREMVGGGGSSSADLFSKRSNMKRTMMANITEKLRALPSGAGARNVVQRVLGRIPVGSGGTGSSLVHPDSSSRSFTGSPPRGTLSSDPRTAPVAAKEDHQHATTFIEALIETPNLQLNALEESLFLKSALDMDDNDEGPDGPGGDCLGVLEDGIRYELPSKKPKSDELAQNAIADLTTQVQQLSRAMAELQNSIQEERANAVQPTRMTPRSQF